MYIVTTRVIRLGKETGRFLKNGGELEALNLVVVGSSS